MIAALVSATALVIAYGIIPYARRWSAREESIAAKREQLARLQWLARNETRLTRTAEERERALDAGPRRLIVGETPNLASAELQRAILEIAESSQLEVQQVDVANTTDPAAATHIAARLSATGDVVGLADLLERVARGPTFAEVQELDVQPNALRADLLSISLAVRAPWVQP
jgi:hypothetical protein